MAAPATAFVPPRGRCATAETADHAAGQTRWRRNTSTTRQPRIGNHASAASWTRFDSRSCALRLTEPVDDVAHVVERLEGIELVPGR